MPTSTSAGCAFGGRTSSDRLSTTTAATAATSARLGPFLYFPTPAGQIDYFLEASPPLPLFAEGRKKAYTNHKHHRSDKGWFPGNAVGGGLAGGTDG